MDRNADDSGNGGTVCPECAVGCRLAAGSGNRAVGRVGPSNPNGRLCQHGISAVEGVENRLTEPQVRQDGELVAVSWETALDRVAREFRAHRQSAGPDSLAFLGAAHSTNEENYLLGKLARTLGTNNVDNRARLCHTETARTLSERLGRPASTNSLADLPEADTILVVGANPAKRQPVAFNAAVRPALTDGTTLIHVDPVGTETTELADIHLVPRPGRDALVCDLLSARLAEAGNFDEAFVAERTTDFERFRAGLDSLDIDRATERTGVDAEKLDRAAGAITDGRTAAITGTGIEGGPGPASGPDALVNLLLATGNVGRPGTGLHLFRGLVNEQGALDAGAVPDLLPGHQPVTDGRVRERFAAAWGVEPPAEPGRDANDLLAAFGTEIHGALVVGENPAVVKRGRSWVTDRLAALDTLVLVDIAPNETTPYADVVLPAATLLEKDGTVTNFDRQIQRLQPQRPPPDTARPERKIIQGLGRRLVDGSFEYDDPREIFAEMSRLTDVFGTYPDVSEQWPDGHAVCYQDSFETPDGTADFRPVQPIPNRQQADGLELVVRGRLGDSAHGVAERVEINPVDANERGIDSSDAVVLHGGEKVRVRAAVTEAVRRGTVSLHAAVADPLVREGRTRVTVEQAAERESRVR